MGAKLACPLKVSLASALLGWVGEAHRPLALLLLCIVLH